MTLPAGWTAETETVDRIRLEYPDGARGSAALYVAQKGYCVKTRTSRAPSIADPEARELEEIIAERPSRSVPVDQLVAWLESFRGRADPADGVDWAGTDEGDALLLWMQDEAAEK